MSVSPLSDLLSLLLLVLSPEFSQTFCEDHGLLNKNFLKNIWNIHGSRKKSEKGLKTAFALGGSHPLIPLTKLHNFSKFKSTVTEFTVITTELYSYVV